MHFISACVALGALLSTHVATAAPIARRSALAFTNGDYTGLSVGAPLAITWAGNSGAVTVNLKSGSVENLQTIGTIASGVWGTSTSWVPATAGTYAFEIIDNTGAINYSPTFWVSGGGSSEYTLANTLAKRDLLAVRDGPSFTNMNYEEISTGSPFEITWTGATGPVTITLLNGPATNVQPVFVIADKTEGKSFTWTPPADLVADMYAFQINDSTGAINYTRRFWIGGMGNGALGRRSMQKGVHTEAAHKAHDITMPMNKVEYPCLVRGKPCTN